MASPHPQGTSRGSVIGLVLAHPEPGAAVPVLMSATTREGNAITAEAAAVVAAAPAHTTAQTLQPAVGAVVKASPIHDGDVSCEKARLPSTERRHKKHKKHSKKLKVY